MAYQATVYKVMIASPSDVAIERNIVREVVAEWNAIHSESREIVLLPVGWETHSTPEMGDRPQAILNRQILEGCDLLVAVFWTRLGTPTGTHPSGSVEEIEEHLSAEKPAMIYFSNEPVRLDSVESEQYDQLVSFRKSCRERGLFEQYEEAADFRDKFYRHLQIKLNEDPYFQSETAVDTSKLIVESPPPLPSITLSADARLLLKEAASSNGTVTRLRHSNGVTIGVGKRNFAQGGDSREIARWEAAVDDLARERLIEDKGGKRQVYFVTHKGYELADRLPSSS